MGKGNKAQRRKERHTRKRQEKRKKQSQRQSGGLPGAEFAVGSNARHRQRLAEQVPQAWEGELPVDVAVFDEEVRASLPPELASEVALVRDALQVATESRGDEALKSLSVISRGSPLSEWRLFIRGLVDWLAGDTDSASETWQRLDFERRPGRIAIAMMMSLRTDLDQSDRPQNNGQPEEVKPAKVSPWESWDNSLLYHAKLLRRIRFDRPALRVAEAGAKAAEEERSLLLGPRKIKWLRLFVAEYADTEPDLVATLARTALARAFVQDYANLFDDVVKSLPGPRHDPHNRLLTFFYYRRFTDNPSAEKVVERALSQYLEDDLPRNESLSPALRDAIASQIHYYEAMELIEPDYGDGMMARIFAPPEDAKGIRHHLGAALNAEPRNLAAHKAHVEWLESKLDNDRLTQPKRKPLERELAQVMQRWTLGRPEDAEPRLWLVDHYLESEQLQAARPHVEFLAASRQEDPRVRATPWKWQVLEAMRLCRRKAWLDKVPAQLDKAEELWPSWLPKQWLPYLRAAWIFRNGETEAFEQQRDQISQAAGLKRDSLADACLMLGAAQHMRVPAADLKQFRAPVDQALKQPDKLPIEELLEAGSFFWDLHRARLLYPAYRMHGGKLGKELVSRWKATPRKVANGVLDERTQKAMLWCSEYRFWANNYDVIPPFLTDTVVQHPMFAAATLNAVLKSRYMWRASEKYRWLGPLLREAAQTERDAYCRHWFAQLADGIEDALSKKSKSSFGLPFDNLFGNLFSDDDDDDDDDEDDEFEDDELDFDPNCDCPSCRAAQLAAELARSSGKTTPF